MGQWVTGGLHAFSNVAQTRHCAAKNRQWILCLKLIYKNSHPLTTPYCCAVLNNILVFFGLALSWFKPYVSNRFQFVPASGGNSELSMLDYGVPQGSVIGPILLVLYTQRLSQILFNHFCPHKFLKTQAFPWTSFDLPSHHFLLRLRQKPRFLPGQGSLKERTHQFHLQNCFPGNPTYQYYSPLPHWWCHQNSCYFSRTLTHLLLELSFGWSPPVLGRQTS